MPLICHDRAAELNQKCCHMYHDSVLLSTMSSNMCRFRHLPASPTWLLRYSTSLGLSSAQNSWSNKAILGDKYKRSADKQRQLFAGWLKSKREQNQQFSSDSSDSNGKNPAQSARISGHATRKAHNSTRFVESSLLQQRNSRPVELADSLHGNHDVFRRKAFASPKGCQVIAYQ